ncbi:MAG: S53 family peptidase, partial [Nocardioidaceae bacterium]
MDYRPAGCQALTSYQRTHDFARCFAVIGTHSLQPVPNGTQPAIGGLGAADIQSAYNLPATGQGQTVGIVDAYGDSHAAADLATFRSNNQLAACTISSGCLRIVNQQGLTKPLPPNNAGWGVETSLDLDAVSAACPNCHIVLVQAADSSITNLASSVDVAVRLGAKYVSNSYGIPGELPAEVGYDKYYNHPGVVVTASAGDQGNVTSWPASNPAVVAVGGTRLTVDASVPRGWSESAWLDGGSGCSPYEPRPPYQAGIATHCPRRAIADIAADADPTSGLIIYDTLGQNGEIQAGGTSLASPLIAA